MAVMERDHGWMGFVCHSVAVLLLLCSFALNPTCFSLPKASRTVESEEDYSVAEVLERRTGRILFNGRELENQPRSAPAAENEEMIPVDSYQSDSAEIPEQTSQLENEVTDEATWRLLNTSLFCDQMKGTLEASGPAATDLQVIMGDGYPQPLIQVALTCGYSVQQDSYGLVLEVPFDGCGVVHKAESYVLPMIWRQTPVELTCPILTTLDVTPAPTFSELDQQQPGDAPDQDRPWSSTRSRRHVKPAISPYDTRSPYYPYLYSYYSYMSSLAQNAAPSTNVAAVNTKPVPQTPVQKPSYQPYQYSQSPYYYSYDPYYTLPDYQTSVGSGFGTPVANDQYYQQYYQPYYYPYVNPAVQPESPENPDVYYYPVIQHYYGRNPYQLTTTTKAPTTTRRPCTAARCTTTTTKAPCTTTTTRAPCTAAPCTTTTTKAPCTTTTTRAPCTAAPCTTTTTKSPCTATTCSKPKTTTTSRCYPGRNCPFVSYGREPFKPIVSYGRSLKIPDEQEYAPDASYQSEVIPPVEMQPGLQWESVPWFPPSTDPGDSPFDWKSLLPRQV